MTRRNQGNLTYVRYIFNKILDVEKNQVKLIEETVANFIVHDFCWPVTH